MKLVACQAASQAVERVLANPCLKRFPGFRRFESLDNRFDRQVDARVLGKLQVFVRLEHAADYRCGDLFDRERGHSWDILDSSGAAFTFLFGDHAQFVLGALQRAEARAGALGFLEQSFTVARAACQEILEEQTAWGTA
jgi:hypothetical protein